MRNLVLKYSDSVKKQKKNKNAFIILCSLKMGSKDF